MAQPVTYILTPAALPNRGAKGKDMIRTTPFHFMKNANNLRGIGNKKYLSHTPRFLLTVFQEFSRDFKIPSNVLKKILFNCELLVH